MNIFLLKVIEKGMTDLYCVSEELMDDKEVVLAAIKKDSVFGILTLQRASEKLKAEKEVVLFAIENSLYNKEDFQTFIPTELQSDKDIINLRLLTSKLLISS